MRIEKDRLRAVVAAAVIFTLFVAGVLLPLRYQRSRYSQRIAIAQKTLGIDLKDAKNLAMLNNEVIELRQVVQGAQQYVPETDELADVLRGLSEALTSHGIIEREMQTKSTLTYAEYSVIPIELQFHASYPSVHGVLRQIEGMRRLIRIDQLKVRGDRDDSQEPLDVNLTLSTFIARPLEPDDG